MEKYRALKAVVKNNYKPGDLSRSFDRRKNIPILAVTNGGFANSYRTIVAASICSNDFTVQGNEIQFHPFENIQFLLDGFPRNKKRDVNYIRYGGWLIPYLSFYDDYRDKHCFNLMNLYGLNHDISEIALYPEYKSLLVRHSKINEIKSAYSLTEKLPNVLGIQIRIWDAGGDEAGSKISNVTNEHLEMRWGSLIFQSEYCHDMQINFLANKVFDLASVLSTESFYLSCNNIQFKNHFQTILIKNGLKPVFEKNIHNLPADVFEFLNLTRCASILRTPGSTFGQWASFLRTDNNSDFLF